MREAFILSVKQEDGDFSVVLDVSSRSLEAKVISVGL